MDSSKTIKPYLVDAIEGLYQSFDLPHPARIDGCPCCSSAEGLRTLVTIPRDELTGEQLEEYAVSVLWTAGSPNDLRYFLPRLIELSVLDQLPTGPETVFKKIQLADWRSWPSQEQESLEAFAHAIVRDMTEQVYSRQDMDRWIIALAEFLDDLLTFVHPLLNQTPATQENLFRLYEWNLRALGKGKLSNGFLDRRHPNYQTLVAWFRRQDVLAAIDHAYSHRI